MPGAADLPTLGIVVITTVVALGFAWVLARAVRRRHEFGSPVDRATYATLHTASLASQHLRDGLTPESASKAAKHLRAMLGTQAIALCDNASTLAWDGKGSHHREQVWRHASEVLASGRTVVLDARDVACGDPNCQIRTAILAPVISEDRTVAALAAYGPSASAGLARATEEVAVWVSTQVGLAELGRQRTRAVEAELRALRAQISPHFIFNSLAAIASFVRTDPDRARELLLEFADFTRYSLRRGAGRTPPWRRSWATSSAIWHSNRLASGTGCRSPFWWRQRCCPSPCRSWRSSRWWRTPSITGSSPRRVSGTSASRQATMAPRPRSSSRTTESGPTPRSCAQCSQVSRARTRSVWAMSTHAFARSTATITVSSSRRRRVPARR